MINKIIEFSAEHKFLVFLFIGVAAVLGWHSMKDTKLDAIPDLSDTQVIVYAKWDRSPDIMEDQVSYPITSALLGMPKVKDIRAFSDFGYSYIYIIFDEGTDIYWARSRTLEYMNSVIPRLPKGVNVELAKDATAVGWVYQYALVDTSGQYSLEQMRSYQDWYLRYALQSVSGVAEVVPVGGFVRQYQVKIEQRCRRQAGRVFQPRVHGARTRLYQIARRHPQYRCHGKSAERHASASRGPGDGHIRARHAPRRRRTEW